MYDTLAQNALLGAALLLTSTVSADSAQGEPAYQQVGNEDRRKAQAMFAELLAHWEAAAREVGGAPARSAARESHRESAEQQKPAAHR